MIRLGLLGATGRMGKMIQALVTSEFSTQAKIEVTSQEGSQVEPLLTADVVIDFSLPQATAALVQAALSEEGSLPAFVFGTTGLHAETQVSLSKLASRAPTLYAPNFSEGVNILFHLVQRASPLLLKLGYQPAIEETHHIHKKDNPSGTAVRLQELVNPADPRSVPAHGGRKGDVIGDHTVTFEGPLDRLELSHHAKDRSIFARGAVRAALWLAKTPPRTGKLLSMKDFLAL